MKGTRVYVTLVTKLRDPATCNFPEMVIKKLSPEPLAVAQQRPLRRFHYMYLPTEASERERGKLFIARLVFTACVALPRLVLPAHHCVWVCSTLILFLGHTEKFLRHKESNNSDNKLRMSIITCMGHKKLFGFSSFFFSPKQKLIYFIEGHLWKSRESDSESSCEQQQTGKSTLDVDIYYWVLQK